MVDYISITSLHFQALNEIIQLFLDVSYIMYVLKMTKIHRVVPETKIF